MIMSSVFCNTRMLCVLSMTYQSLSLPSDNSFNGGTSNGLGSTGISWP